jgi:hypothetical protein
MTEGTRTGEPDKHYIRHYIKRETAQARAYSQAVITQGGKTVWLAGQIGAQMPPADRSVAILTPKSMKYFLGSAAPSKRPAALWPIW